MWVSMYLAWAVLIGDAIFTSPTGDHPRRPRGGQLSREKRRRERTPGMLNLTNQFHEDSFDLFVIGNKQYFVPNRRPWSIYRNAFRENYAQTRLFAVSVWLVQESFLQYDFSVKIFILQTEKIKEIPQIKHVSKTKQNEKRTNRRNKIRGLIEGEFVNTQG